MGSRAWAFPWILQLILVAGCASSPPERIFVLGNPPNSAAGISVESDRPIIQFLPVSVPDYLDTRDILIRSGQNEVKASPTGRWAERLSVGLTRALTAVLSTQLPNANIIADQPIMPPAQQILVDVETFEIGPAGQCLLTARWTLSSGDGRRVLRSERGTFIDQAADTTDAAIAAVMTRSINRLGERIAAVERELEVSGV